MADPLRKHSPAESERPRVLIIGAGFAGFHCARVLDRRLGATADLVLVNPVDHTVYTALLPDVVGGLIDPRYLATPLRASLPNTKVLLGKVTAIDPDAHTCTVRRSRGGEELLTWDRLVLNPGSVTRTMGVAGVLEHAHGFKTLAEAQFLRERILQQLEYAGATTDTHARERHASFVVVGGGFTGLELAAQAHRLSRAALRQYPALASEAVRWTVLEAGPRVLEQFPARLARRALDRIRKRGVDVRLGAGVAEIAPDHVKLASGEMLPTHTVIWTAGVTPAP